MPWLTDICNHFSRIIVCRDYEHTTLNKVCLSSLLVCCNLPSLLFLFFFFLSFLDKCLFLYQAEKYKIYYFNILIAVIIRRDLTKQQHWQTECWMSLVCVKIFYFSGVVWAFYCQKEQTKKKNMQRVGVLSLDISLKMGWIHLM